MIKRRRAASAGVTLTELLVAAGVAAVVLAASWAWLWSVAAPARGLGARAQARSAAAYALRAVAGEVRATDRFVVPDAHPAGQSLSLRHRHPGATEEAVPITWDPSRGVLWWKTSSTYLADHVERFAVTYRDAQGEPITPPAAGVAIPGVAVVHLEITVTTGGYSETATTDVAVRLP